MLSSELREIQARPGWANARDSVTACRLLYKARATRCASAAEAEPSYTAEDASSAMAKLRETRPLGEHISIDDAMRAADAMMQAAAAAAGASARPPVQVGNLAGSAAPPPLRPPPEREAEQEERVEDITHQVQAEQQAGSSEPDIDPVYAALLKACVAEGYDSSHERRKELIEVLTVVRDGGDFPDGIMSRVTEATKLSAAKAHAMLKPQVHRVLEAMSGAVQEEEARREDLRRLEAEQQLDALRLKQEEFRKMQEALQRCRACPMGFSWYRCGAGWRCTGGSHYKSDADLARWNGP